MGRVGYAPTTPAMSMQYSTIELTALVYLSYCNFFLKKILVSLFTPYINEKLIKNKVILKSEKKDPLGKSGKNVDNRYRKEPI